MRLLPDQLHNGSGWCIDHGERLDRGHGQQVHVHVHQLQSRWSDMGQLHLYQFNKSLAEAFGKSAVDALARDFEAGHGFTQEQPIWRCVWRALLLAPPQLRRKSVYAFRFPIHRIESASAVTMASAVVVERWRRRRRRRRADSGRCGQRAVAARGRSRGGARAREGEGGREGLEGLAFAASLGRLHSSSRGEVKESARPKARAQEALVVAAVQARAPNGQKRRVTASHV